jgi:hypothetical protein
MSEPFPARPSAAATANPAKTARMSAGLSELSCLSTTADTKKIIAMPQDIMNAVRLRNLKTARNLKKTPPPFTEMIP